MIAAFDRDQGGDRYTAKLRGGGLPRVTDGRADLDGGQDWNDRLRQDQQAQQQRPRQDRGQGMSR